ncbi:redoxin domain-containing protein [Nannocystis punicea]|uniref:Redoxin domain-containing protein n=1 Tax=Nannocystis punicea TaxID=2995304 RepID=A0ABY7H5N0_9BACT|nr:redoxin domain-containing protein [Nannocystis poenicansa]WAS94571.1 redoxin domain-containing protein [Nannocystis poenicansa]
MADSHRVSRALLFVALVCACTQPQPPAPREAPKVARPVAPTADAADADRVRDLQYAYDPEQCVTEGEALLRVQPNDHRARAWTIACVADSGRRLEAEALADKMIAELPDEPWAAFARVAVGLVDRDFPDAGALIASEPLTTALAYHPDVLQLRARALLAFDRTDDATTLAVAHPEALQPIHLRALFKRSNDARDQLPAALAEAEKAQGVPAVDAAAAAAQALTQAERHDDALKWMEKAIAASPASVRLRQQRWQLWQQAPGRSDDEKREAIVRDVDALLELRGQQPSALLAAAAILRELGQVERADTLERRIAGEFTDSPANEKLLYRRIAAELGPDGAPRPERTAELRAELAGFLARPQLHEPSLREEAGRLRFELLRADPATPPDELLAAIEFMRVAGRTDLESAHTDGPIALAERGVHLERAEALAREGAAAIERFGAELRATGLALEVCDILRRDRLGLNYDALGAVLLAAGRLDEAEAALKQSQEVSPGYPKSLARLAALARKRGDMDAAEGYLAAGFEQDVPGRENPCKVMLEQIYREEHGDLKGYEKFVEKIKARARDIRRAKVIAGKAASPAPAPAFALERLDGTKVGNDTLRGKIAVIKFWFTTCKPCIDELPEFEKLIKDYARDREVEFLTIHSGGETEEVAQWMREHKHAFPVLLDRGFCQKAGIAAFPTFWILDRDGGLAYSLPGAAPNMREEFAWRIESLRG